MIGCFRAAPNSGPTSKSLPGPQFSFGLDLFSQTVRFAAAAPVTLVATLRWASCGARTTGRPAQGCDYCYPNGPEAGREAGWGSEFVPLKKRQAGSFILLHKISRTAYCFGIRTFLKQYSCYESATNWYTDHQYLAQYSDIINNLQEIPLIFCNYAVRSCGTWRKGPGQSPCNGLSISDLELYVTETSTGVCDPRHRLKCGTHA